MADDHDTNTPPDSIYASSLGSSQVPRPAHYNYSRSNDPTLQGATAHNRYLGSPMPWLDRNLRLTMDRDRSYRNIEEESSEGSSNDKCESKWIWIILTIVLVLVIIVVGVILIVTLGFPDDDDEAVMEDMETVGNSFLTKYDAILTLVNEDFTADLNDPNSPRSQQLMQDDCEVVDGLLEATEGYAGCEGQGFSPGSRRFHFKLKILYQISISVATSTSAEERVNAIFAAFIDRRNSFEPTLVESFVREVNADVNLSNAQINTAQGASETSLVDVTQNLCVPNPCVTGVCGRVFTNNINTGYNCLCLDTHVGLQCQIPLNPPTQATDTKPPPPEITTQPQPVDDTTLSQEPEETTRPFTEVTEGITENVAYTTQEYTTEPADTCPVYLNDSSGTIKSPNFPGFYPEDYDCVWHITGPENTIVIRVTFRHFALEPGDDYEGCYDAVSLVEGIVERNDLPQSELQTFCGIQNPGLIALFARQATIWFTSDQVAVDSGFELLYEVFTEENCTSGSDLCGHHGTCMQGANLDFVCQCDEPFGGSFCEVVKTCGGTPFDLVPGEMITLQSPGYPNGYDPDMFCEWHITAPAGYDIVFFLEDVSLEYEDGCGYDSLDFYNGDSDEAELLDYICGEEMDHDNMFAPIISHNTDQVTVIFQTDEIGEFNGFSMKLTAIADATLCHPEVNPCLNEGECKLTDDEDGFMCECKNHTRGDICEEQEFGSCARIGNLNCNEVNCIEESYGYSCNCSETGTLPIPEEIKREDDLTSGCAVKNLCVQENYSCDPPKTCIMDIVARVPLCQCPEGTYGPDCHDSVDASCGGTLTATETLQYFSTPGYPDKYPSNVNCTWTIESSGDQRVKLQWVQGVIGDCDEDILEVITDNENEPVVLCEYARSGKTQDFYSDGNAMTVIFTTNGNFEFNGALFSYAAYSGTCEGYCKNGGLCEFSIHHGRSCNCSETEYFGPTCEVLDECVDNPCNEGKCTTQKDGTALCDCNDGYMGEFCDIPNPDCTDDFECTENQGKCSHNGTDTYCQCKRGYGGPSCSELQCGNPTYQPHSFAPKIVGGLEVDPKYSYPWLGSLRREDGEHDCGFSIIDKEWAIGAAHCLMSPLYGLAVGIHSQEEITAENTYNIAQVYNHEDYDDSTTTHDIALVRIWPPLEFSDRVHPICLPDSGQEFDSTHECIVAGWGTTRFDDQSIELLHIEARIWPQDDCEEPNGGFLEGEREAKICAGGVADEDSCQGDSGGALACKDGDKWVLTGVVSYGVGDDCGEEETPSFYAKTSNYIEWIEEKIRNAPPVCLHIFTDMSGNFSSPEYPDVYQSEQFCRWEISAPEGSQIEVTFEDYQLAYPDHIEIFGAQELNGTDGQPLFGKIKSTTGPKGIVVSEGNHLAINFYSDSSINAKGFFATYELV